VILKRDFPFYKLSIKMSSYNYGQNANQERLLDRKCYILFGWVYISRYLLHLIIINFKFLTKKALTLILWQLKDNNRTKDGEPTNCSNNSSSRCNQLTSFKMWCKAASASELTSSSSIPTTLMKVPDSSQIRMTMACQLWSL